VTGELVPSGPLPAVSAPVGPILVASAGEPFPRAVLDAVVDAAGEERPEVVVLSVARIWGTALGLPHPGLYPTRREMDDQWVVVDTAADCLKEHGFPVRTAVVRARHAGRAIARSADKLGAGLVVIAAPGGRRFTRMLRGDPPAEIARRTNVAVRPVAVTPKTPVAERGA
jgi:nucleotide-binding universal stress UspA family protein